MIEKLQYTYPGRLKNLLFNEYRMQDIMFFLFNDTQSVLKPAIQRVSHARQYILSFL